MKKIIVLILGFRKVGAKVIKPIVKDVVFLG